MQLAAPETSPQVVVLAACASQEKNVELSSLTAIISRNGVTVIGFPAKTDDQAASNFIVAFVEAFGKTTPLQAFDVALAAIRQTNTATGVFMMNAAMEYSYRVHTELKEIKQGVNEIRNILYRAGGIRAGNSGSDSDSSSGNFRGPGDDEDATLSLNIRGIGQVDTPAEAPETEPETQGAEIVTHPAGETVAPKVKPVTASLPNTTIVNADTITVETEEGVLKIALSSNEEKG